MGLSNSLSRVLYPYERPTLLYPALHALSLIPIVVAYLYGKHTDAKLSALSVLSLCIGASPLGCVAPTMQSYIGALERP